MHRVAACPDEWETGVAEGISYVGGRAGAVRGFRVFPGQTGDGLTIMSTAMSGSLRPPVAGADPAPVAPHRSAALADASRVRLSLPSRRHGGAHEAGLDGAWWPRTPHTLTELTTLVERLELDLGVITRLSLSGTGWDSTPCHVRAGGRDVRLVWFSLRDPHTVIVGYGTEEITLLIIPAEATEESAIRAMTMAADRDNDADAAGVCGPVP
jgi:hypothetical protein